MRYSYWSNSALADWVRSFCGVKKPIAQTSKGWKEWRVNYKNNHKFVYWLTEEFFNKFQDFIYWPKDKLDNIYYAINARFKDRYYIASSDLNKWKYHEIDTRMLHCNFQILVDFVECEQASMSLWSSRKEGKERKRSSK